MIIKKFVAKTKEEAVEMAKLDLGNNAYIMNMKEINPRGLSRIFVKKKVEVTAALEENIEYDKKEKQPVKDTSYQPDIIHDDKQKPEDDWTKKISNMQAFLDNNKREEEKESSEEVEREELKKKNFVYEKPVRKKPKEEEKEPRKESRREQSVTITENTEENHESEVNTEKTQEMSRSDACRQLIYEQLVENEVEPKIAKQLMDDIGESVPVNAPVDQILASTYQKIVLMLGQPFTYHNIGEETKFVFFLGSTGVGKTTTIAKLASMMKLEKKMNIALVTADTYRIAAVDQLKTYANILGVPLTVIYSSDDLKNNMEQLKKFDLCLIDTAGRSHRNKEQIQDINDLLSQIPINQRSVYLVMNAGTKYNDLKEIAKAYLDITDFSMIFTKLDETSCTGIMLNMRLETKKPLSYVTWGQNVPDDIGEIDAQKIAKKLLGGKS